MRNCTRAYHPPTYLNPPTSLYTHSPCRRSSQTTLDYFCNLRPFFRLFIDLSLCAITQSLILGMKVAHVLSCNICVQFIKRWGKCAKFFNLKAFSWLQCYDREVADFSLCCNILVARLQYYEGCCNVIRPAITFFQQLTRSPPSWDISPAGEKLNFCVEKMLVEEVARGNSWRGVCMRIAIGRHSHGATFITPIILITITKGPPSSSSSSSPLWTKCRECKQLISVKPCLQNKTRIIVRMWSCEGWVVRAVLTHRPYATRSGISSQA